MLRSKLASPFSFLIRRLNSFPSRQMKSSPGCMMPHLAAMALAVLMLSPVTIRTVMPARWHFRIASGTSKRSKEFVYTETKCQSYFRLMVDHILWNATFQNAFKATHLGSHRVLYSNHSDASQLSHYFSFVVPFWLWIWWQITVGNADGSQPLTRHWFNHLAINY